ncbi:zinc-binding protein A33-like [Protopterus annectens]|uniref:zinc-binding protein A33-like n=1 Tax=Protopterus annectens TaxID=7888 RepID=UPI001CFC2A1F|nr:zinc-binding protein A33-like [Protopterus annectens]
MSGFGSTEELVCSICRMIFRDPVTLHCGHNFCRLCVTMSWSSGRPRTCPICRSVSRVQDLNTNHTLRNIAEAFKDEEEQRLRRGELYCREHQERLQMFCSADEEAICVVCHTSKQHAGHACHPINEVAGKYQEEMQKLLKPLQCLLAKLRESLAENHLTIQHLKNQTSGTEKQMKDEFHKLYQFLRSEEKKLLDQLRAEADEKNRVIEAEVQRLSHEIEALSKTIASTQEAVNGNTTLFLKNLKDTRNRTVCTFKEPEKLSETLIDVTKYLSNLQFTVWEKMRTMVTTVPITLDPNTAHARLSVSKDFSSVRLDTRIQQLPDNKERFDTCLSVMGSEGFLSGKHSWNIDVGEKREWAIGVASASVNRKRCIYLNPKYGYWVIALKGEQGYWACTSRWTSLNIQKVPQVITVSVDYEKGTVSFYNAIDKSCIYIFKKEIFTEQIYPYVGLYLNRGLQNSIPLKVCPFKVTVLKV